MKKLSIAAAWDESTAFVRRDFGRLFLIAFGLLALPTVILQSFMPQPAPGQPAEGGAWILLFIIPAIIISVLGSLTIAALAVAPGTQPGDAFARALRRLLPMVGAALLLLAAVFICGLPLLIMAAILSGGTQAESAAGALWTMLILLPVFVFVSVRLMLMTPVGAAEEGGPVAIVKRSWALTRGHFWRLLGFMIIFMIIFIVVSLAVMFVGGSVVMLIAGNPVESGLARVLIGLLGGLVNAALMLYFTAMLARIYVQLRGGETSGT